MGYWCFRIWTSSNFRIINNQQRPYFTRSRSGDARIVFSSSGQKFHIEVASGCEKALSTSRHSNIGIDLEWIP